MRIIFFIVLIIIIILALYPKDIITLAQNIPYEDKIKHNIAFLVLSFLFFRNFKNIKFYYKFYILIIFACAIEIAQSFVGRQASFTDIVASISGVLLSFLILKVIEENIKYK